MERTWGSVRPGLSAQLRTPGLCLGLWLAWRTLGQAPGASGSLDGHLDGAWGSGSVYLEKVPAFFYFAGTFFDAKPIETHRGSFHCVIWLDAGTFDSKISYRPANKLTSSSPRTSLLALIREQAYSHCPVREMSLWQSVTTK